MQYYVVTKDDSGINGEIAEVIPCKSVKRHVSEYFGGVEISERDNRTFEELQKASDILCLNILEGGCGTLVVNGSDLHKTFREAYEASTKRDKRSEKSLQIADERDAMRIEEYARRQQTQQ